MRYSVLLFLALMALCQPCLAEKDYVSGRRIWIWQEDQIGEAVENGEVVFSFRIITGLEFSKFRTREGDFRIYMKVVNYVNRDGVAMPFAMFFDGGRALHGWSWDEPFPDDEESPWLASHGCVSSDKPGDLYDWAPNGTPVHVRGERTGYY